VDALLAAAAAAFGSPLTDPIDLGGSTYSTVLRCRNPVRGTVIVKSYPQTADGAQGFAAEAAGLALTSDANVGPGLLAVDQAARLIVMTDLGDSPSLADLLLGGSAAQAEDALLSWAFESAEIHSVFLDAAYLRMPFTSCWCVFRLPAELAAAAELPSICALMGDLIAATRDWQVPDLPVYPAFR